MREDYWYKEAACEMLRLVQNELSLSKNYGKSPVPLVNLARQDTPLLSELTSFTAEIRPSPDFHSISEYHQLFQSRASQVAGEIKSKFGTDKWIPIRHSVHDTFTDRLHWEIMTDENTGVSLKFRYRMDYWQFILMFAPSLEDREQRLAKSVADKGAWHYKARQLRKLHGVRRLAA